VERVHLCKRLSLEFMHYVIVSKSLRKCFISIKGYYFQAEIKGQKVTWIMPHKLAYQTPDDVDFRIMSTFVEFYSILLGFVNYKSYQDVGLIYPPKLSITQKDNNKETEDIDLNDEYLASLNCDFLKLGDQDGEEELKDEFPLADEENPDQIEKARLEEENLSKLKNLFKGLKFFLNREVPREQFVLAIRSFTGQVSWDKTTALGATYQEDDETITHQIVDRPLVGKTYLNRVYVQPQWIFDSINENMLLPVDDYLPGTLLPPHLSPFSETSETGYVPPEKQRLIRMKLGLPEVAEDEKQPKTEIKKETNDINNKKRKIEETTELKKREQNKNGKNKKASESVESNEEEEDDGDVDTENEDDINDMKVDLDSPDEEEESDSEKEIEENEKQEEVKKNDVCFIII
jgi:pescadillo protein